MVSESVLNEKQASVDALVKIAESSASLVVAHYRGLTVTEMTGLRSESRKLGVKVKVVKNTLAKRALEKTDYQSITDHLTGPTVLCFSDEEPSAAAKLVKECMKSSPSLVVRAIGLENKVLAAEAIDQIAKMPNKQQAIAMLLGGLQAPVSGLACALKETYARLVRVLFEVSKVKQA